MTTRKINIQGMSCQHCVHAVKSELSKLAMKIIEVKIGSAEFEYDENKITEKEIKKAIETAGYKVA